MVNPDYQNQNALPADIKEEVDDPAEVERKKIAAKRMFFFLLGLCVLLFGIVVFEIIELSMGGRL